LVLALRWLSKATQALRAAILAAFEDAGKPVTVREMFSSSPFGGGQSQVTARPQRQLLALRREGLVSYNWVSDNTFWMRKPTTYAGLGDFFDRAADL
jgi:hypothetical protein